MSEKQDKNGSLASASNAPMDANGTADTKVGIDDKLSTDNEVPLRLKLNLETARAPWRELQTFFASGMVLNVSKSLDLVLVGEQFAADNKALFEEWLSQGLVAQVKDQQALAWYEAEATVWTLVIKPWILVQEIEE